MLKALPSMRWLGILNVRESIAARKEDRQIKA